MIVIPINLTHIAAQVVNDDVAHKHLLGVIKCLMKHEEKLQAVVLLRLLTGWGILEAKEFAELFERKG